MLVDRARHLGWQKPADKQTIRALCRALPIAAIDLPAAAPSSDNSALCCDLDQGPLGSCTANAWSQVVYMEMLREGHESFIPSRLANYYYNRYRDGSASEDVGDTVGGAFEVGADMGVAAEVVWPYDVSRFAQRPPAEVDRDAFDRRGKVRTNYFPILGSNAAIIDQIERVLTSGRGVAFGRPVTMAFCSKLPSGIVQPPTADDMLAGGHAETIVGHDRAAGYFLIKGSWGRDFHEPGYPPGCYRIAYETVLGGSDFWFVALDATGGL